jgi:hypothetical protein
LNHSLFKEEADEYYISNPHVATRKKVYYAALKVREMS